MMPKEAVVIDAHLHLGRDVLYGRDTTGEQIIAALNANAVDAALVQPGHDNTGIIAVQRAHDAIYRLSIEHRNRIFGVCAPNPHLPPQDYEAEVGRCLAKRLSDGVEGAWRLGQVA
jgi:uncharacterized protein